MRSPIRFRCPVCRARIRAPFQLLGQTRSCPQCGQTLTVRVQPPEDSGPLLLSEDLPESSAAFSSARFHAGRKPILVVDDDQELNNGIRSLFERHGHEVIQAYDGIEAKEMVRQHRPDLMVLDLMMARMGGAPVLEYFRTQAQAPPVIMITAKEGSQHRAYAQYLGAVDYLRKPFDLRRLLESAEKNLGLRQ
jgi:CheY-like chemotaxis protein